MKKIYTIGKHRDFLLRKSRKPKKLKFKLLKGQNTRRRRAYLQLRKRYSESLRLWDKERVEFYKEYYAPVNFRQGLKLLTIDKRIGAEEDIDYMASAGEALIEGSPASVKIDLEGCSRVWPSSVMMFCSFLRLYSVGGG